MFNDDPAIQMIRNVRHKISEQHQHDPRKLVEYYIEKQKAHAARLIKAADFTRHNAPK